MGETKLCDLSASALSSIFRLLDVAEVTRLVILGGCMPLMVKGARLSAVTELHATRDVSVESLLLSPRYPSYFRSLTHLTILNGSDILLYDGLFGWVTLLPPTMVSIVMHDVSSDLWLSNCDQGVNDGTRTILDVISSEYPIKCRPVHIGESFPLLQILDLNLLPWSWPWPFVEAFFESLPPSLTDLAILRVSCPMFP